jgi:hypothetical protein
LNLVPTFAFASAASRFWKFVLSPPDHPMSPDRDYPRRRRDNTCNRPDGIGGRSSCSIIWQLEGIHSFETWRAQEDKVSQPFPVDPFFVGNYGSFISERKEIIIMKRTIIMGLSGVALLLAGELALAAGQYGPGVSDTPKAALAHCGKKNKRSFPRLARIIRPPRDCTVARVFGLIIPLSLLANVDHPEAASTKHL